LRDALSALLESGDQELTVKNEDGDSIGMVDLNAVMAASVEGWQPSAPVIR